MSELDLVCLMTLVVLGVCAIWGLMFCIVWVLDRISGWIHRRISRRRPWS